MRADNAMVQVALARAALGIVPLPCYMAAGQADLVRLLAAEFDLALDLWLLTHRDLRRTKRIRAVLEFVAEAVKRDIAMFRGSRSSFVPAAPLA